MLKPVLRGLAGCRAPLVLTSITVAGRRRDLGSDRVSALKPQAQVRLTVSAPTPSGVPAGVYGVLARVAAVLTDSASSGRGQCARIGTRELPAPGAIVGVPTPTQPQPGPTQIPTSPMTIAPDTPTFVPDSYDGMTGSYYVNTPPSYDTTGATPMRLLVWMHGCCGQAAGDSEEVTGSNPPDTNGYLQPDDARDYIVISIGGRDGGCWNPDTDLEQVLMAISDVTTQFNIDRRHIFIGGDSAGGDLAWRTIFYTADEFAGILAVDTDPVRDTGPTLAQSLATAAWTFNVAQVDHWQDNQYHINPCTDCIDGRNDPGVTPVMNALENAGYNVNYFIRPGDHFDFDNFQDGTGTDYDWRQYVRPFIDDPAWESPG
jgi:hypothetical protein